MQLQKDIDLLEFETKIRGLMRELIEPVLTKAQKDRESILVIQKSNEDYEFRINLLEKSIFEKKLMNQRTKFDDIDDKFLHQNILISQLKDELLTEINLFTAEVKNYFFKIDQKMIVIESYKSQIDSNTMTIDSSIKSTSTTMYDMRNSLEKEKQQHLDDFFKLEVKIKNLQNIMDQLPAQVADCYTKCRTSEDQTRQIKNIIEEIQHRSIQLEKNKADVLVFQKFEKNTNDRISEVEIGIDVTLDKSNSLENWIDIYMPLRTQHQITETIRECLDKKGKHMLGIVDGLICNKLRERVFNDIGKPQLQFRCLELINKLQLEEKVLSQEDLDEIKHAQIKNNRWSNNEKQLQSAIIEVDVQQKIQEAESEMVNLVKDLVQSHFDAELAKIQINFDQKLKNFQKETTDSILQVHNSIKQKATDASQFQMALKTEIEEISNVQRNQNLENLNLIKGISSNLRNLKESYQYFKQNDFNVKQLMNQFVNYLSYINQILSYKKADTDILEFKSNSPSNLSNSIFENQQINRLSPLNKEASEKTILDKASDALKRLQIQLFRSLQNQNVTLQEQNQILTKESFSALKNPFINLQNSIDKNNKILEGLGSDKGIFKKEFLSESRMNKEIFQNTADFKTMNNTLQDNSSTQQQQNKKYINIVANLTDNSLENTHLDIIELDQYLKNNLNYQDNISSKEQETEFIQQTENASSIEINTSIPKIFKSSISRQSLEKKKNLRYNNSHLRSRSFLKKQEDQLEKKFLLRGINPVEHQFQLKKLETVNDSQNKILKRFEMQQGSNPRLNIITQKLGYLPDINGNKTRTSSQINSQSRDMKNTQLLNQESTPSIQNIYKSNQQKILNQFINVDLNQNDGTILNNQNFLGITQRIDNFSGIQKKSEF